MGFPVPGCLGRNSPPPWLDRVGRLPVTNQPAVMIFGPSWFSFIRSAVNRDSNGIPIPMGRSPCPSFLDRAACRHSRQSTTQHWAVPSDRGVMGSPHPVRPPMRQPYQRTHNTGSSQDMPR